MRRWLALLLMCCLPLQTWAGRMWCRCALPGDGEGGIAAATVATCHPAAHTAAVKPVSKPTVAAANAGEPMPATTDEAHDCRLCPHCILTAAVPPPLPVLAFAAPQGRIVLAQTPHASLSHAPNLHPPRRC